ncbi:MAG: hypothetical protein PHC70_03935 [Patescibacteria group bacterium]|nr:hypothetical protein [Patescibacteria group bacterium]
MKPEGMKKPPSLFHGSSSHDIETLEPRNKTHRSPEEGPVIFATPNIGLASIFMMETDDSWTSIGTIDGTPHVVINMDQAEFATKDKGGTIYELPNHTFTTDPERGMGTKEWTSQEPVKPIRSIHYESCLDAMKQNGVQVFFVTSDIFKRLKEAPNGDEKVKIIKTLTPEK